MILARERRNLVVFVGSAKIRLGEAGGDAERKKELCFRSPSTEPLKYVPGPTSSVSIFHGTGVDNSERHARRIWLRRSSSELKLVA
jgi:hypothetical protein